MPLPGALLFFRMRCSPFISLEPRYREMLKRALAHHRMFLRCAAQNRTALNGIRPPTFSHRQRWSSFAPALKQSDGTANLILQGLETCQIQRFFSRKHHSLLQ